MRLLLLLCCIAPAMVLSQYAPAAGKPGSTAIAYDSSCFKDWAVTCNLRLGYRDSTQPDSGYVNVGKATSALGPAKENGVVSLGDGGSATLTFQRPIENGPGWDFAVFENSFLDTFLELAFVEVSTDGQRFVRFPAASLSDTLVQTPAFGFTFPEKINNLAGKYRVGYGTPFDLEELKDSVGLDIMDIRFVRIVDVIGSLQDALAQRDHLGNKINDPWPTPFPSSGFDLDAVGVIHSSLSTISQPAASNIQTVPNPSNGNFAIHSKDNQSFTISTIQGQIVAYGMLHAGNNTIHVSLPDGIYVLALEKNNNKQRLQIRTE